MTAGRAFNISRRAPNSKLILEFHVKMTAFFLNGKCGPIALLLAVMHGTRKSSWWPVSGAAGQ